MKQHRHRKLTPEMLVLLREEARKRITLTPYKIIAELAGVQQRTIENLMHQLMREERLGKLAEHIGVSRGAVEVTLDKPSSVLRA